MGVNYHNSPELYRASHLGMIPHRFFPMGFSGTDELMIAQRPAEDLRTPCPTSHVQTTTMYLKHGRADRGFMETLEKSWDFLVIGRCLGNINREYITYGNIHGNI